MVRLASIVVAGVAIARVALADPTPPAGDKTDAQSLVLSGAKLIEAHDYLGALAVFKDAYARFPSSKILLNIGTAERLLGRNAEAANHYQRYADAPDADPAKAKNAREALVELDKLVGHLDLAITPTDAEVQVNDDEWLPAALLKEARVEAGPFTVRVRKTGFQTTAKSAAVEVGQRANVEITLVAVAQDTATTTPSKGPTSSTSVTTEVPPPVTPEAPPSRWGGFALAHVDFSFKGAAAFVGGSFDATDRLAVQAAAIIGPNSGGYAGAKFTLLKGKVMPYVAGGFPVFFSSGARFGLRAAVGGDFTINSHVAFVVELGVEDYLNAQMPFVSTLFIPAVGIAGKL
jgi:hypothetical protein